MASIKKDVLMIVNKIKDKHCKMIDSLLTRLEKEPNEYDYITNLNVTTWEVIIEEIEESIERQENEHNNS